jgi:hypothetical protein
MKNKGLIITGLVVFFIIVTTPLWWNLIAGSSDQAPEPKLSDKAKAVKQEKAAEVAEGKKYYCVESTEFMRKDHMQLLYDWREEVVRNGLRTYINSKGEKYDMSLTNTCLDCHTNKSEFCDTCHNYTSARPYCWDCHNTKENIDG